MSTDLSELVRSEIALAKAELQESVRHAGIGAGLFGTAGVVALYGLGALVAAAILGLALVVDAWLAALVVAVVLFAAAGVAALVGKKQVAESTPPVQRSVENVKADVEAVKHPGTAHPDTTAPTPEGDPR
ncbi:phage holin family protein [Phycicoccus sp. CSK15P-2]|nr:phage holin family protein [Phycicoccus sp. CSK15P-2]